MLRDEVPLDSVSPSQESSPPGISAAALLGLTASTSDELAVVLARGIPASALTRLTRHLQLERNTLMALFEPAGDEPTSRKPFTSRA